MTQYLKDNTDIIEDATKKLASTWYISQNAADAVFKAGMAFTLILIESEYDSELVQEIKQFLKG